MKTLNQLREENTSLNEDENQTQISNMPFVIMLKRKSIRRYPNGITVCLYYSDKLKRYISIPFDDTDGSAIHAGKEF